MGKIVRTSEEINAQLNKAASAIIKEESNYPFMSYEEGMQAFWLWLIGDSNEKPIED